MYVKLHIVYIITVHVFIGSCLFLYRILCLTRGVPELTNNGRGMEITVSFDDVNRDVADTYIYKRDPQITSVTPLKTFFSGGRMLTIAGTDLDVVRDPRIYIDEPRFYAVRTCTCQRVCSFMLCFACTSTCA